jgi:hypothetical protein
MKESTALTKYDEVLLLDKGFRREIYGTLWKKDKHGTNWCCDPEERGEYLQWYPGSMKGVLETGRTMSRQEFEELFA